MNKDLLEETIRRILEEEYSLKTEMARPLKEILDKIDNISENVVYEHILKCLAYRNKYKYTLNHWENEIYSNIHQISKVKSTNKYPTYKQLMNNCFYTWSDTIKDFYDKKIHDLEMEYGKIDTLTSQQVFDITSEYFKWLFDKLSSEGIVTKDEVFIKLDNLINSLEN